MKDLTKLKDKILEYIDLATVLREDGILQTHFTEEQIGCPFHGPDKKKSARFYRDTDSMYCWTCKESWDLFSYVQTRDSETFRGALEALVKKYRVDVSKVPDAVEGAKQKRLEAKKVKYDTKKFYLEKLQTIVTSMREEIPQDKYTRLVFAYMLLKYSTPDDKFEESIIKIRDAVMRLKKGEVKNG
jgi:DNA primase